MNKSIRIGDTEFSPDVLKALKTFRDWKMLREAAGLKSVGMGLADNSMSCRNTNRIR